MNVESVNGVFLVDLPLGSKGSWKVEIPGGIEHSELFVSMGRKVLAEALSESHSRMRHGQGVIGFVEEFEDFPETHAGHYAWRYGDEGRLEADIRISKRLVAKAKRRCPETEWVVPALGWICHEIYEMDYDLKSADLELEVERKRVGEEGYHEMEHEVIPDARVKRVMDAVLGGWYVWTDWRCLVLKNIDRSEQLVKACGLDEEMPLERMR